MGSNESVFFKVSLLFEVEDLSVASPATVSRCGMVYSDYSDLGWKPYVQSWMEKRQKVWDPTLNLSICTIKHLAKSCIFSLVGFQVETDLLRQLFERYIDKTIAFKKTHCKELVAITELNGVASLCRLYHSLATAENGV